MILKQLLGEILTEMKFVTKRELEVALQKQRERFEEKTLSKLRSRSKLVSEARMAAQIDVFSSGKNGIEAFKQSEYDILITDLGMPDMSGWEVIDLVKKIKPDVLIGLITGWDVADDEAKSKGVSFVISKPFQINQVTKAVADAIQSKSVNDDFFLAIRS